MTMVLYGLDLYDIGCQSERSRRLNPYTSTALSVT